MRRCRGAVALASSAVLLAATACGPRRIALPSGAGAPYDDAPAAYAEAVAGCRGTRTLQASLALSGRAGDTRLRGRVDAGFEAPDKVRLEMRAPFGRPVFILVSPGSTATLLLPREDGVLNGAFTADVVEALVGLPLDGADLRALVSGCGLGAGEPGAGRSYEDGWVVVSTAEGEAFLRRQEGRWRLVAARREGLTVEYSGFASGRPEVMRLQAPGSRADVTVRLSDVEINTTLDTRVFELDVPPEAVPLTLDALRRAGPLGER